MPKVGEGVRTALDELKEYAHGLVPQKGMFSTLDELVQQAPFERAPADQWANYLKPGKMLKRGDMQFPLKQEELDYTEIMKTLDTLKEGGEGANNLSKLLPADSILDPGSPTKDQVLTLLRRNRPTFGLTLNADHENANEVMKQKVKNAVVPEQDQQGFDRIRYGGTTFGPDNPSYRRLWHTSDTAGYQESATRMPSAVSHQQHFDPDTISSSRASIHEVPNSLDNARLVEEIQSDLHQDARDRFRPDKWQDLLSTEDRNTLNELERQKDETVAKRQANYEFPNNAPVEIRDRNENAHLQQLVDLDLRIADMNKKARDSAPRRGYRTPETPFLRGERVMTPGNETGTVFLRMNDDGRAVVRNDRGREFEYDLGDVQPFQRAAAVPDAPFKDASDYARLELKKQLLQAAHSGENWLAMTRGADQVERYSLTGRKAENMTNIYDKVYHGELRKLAQHYGAKVEELKLPVGTGQDVRPRFMRDYGAESGSEAEAYLNGEGLNGGLDDIDGGMIGGVVDDIQDAYRRMSSMYTIPNPGADLVKRMRDLHQRVSGHDPRGLDVKWTDEDKTEYKSITRQVGSDIDDWIQHAQMNGLDKRNKTFPAIRITPEVREKIKKHGASLWAKGGQVKKKWKKLAQGGEAGGNDIDYTGAMLEQATHHPGREPFDPTEYLLGRRSALAKRFAEMGAEQWTGLDEHGQVQGALYHDWSAPKEQWTWNSEANMDLPPLRATEPTLSRGFRTLPEQFFGDRNDPSTALQELRSTHEQMMNRFGLDEPQGLAENAATAGGAVAGQLPIPGGMFGKMAERVPALTKIAAWPAAKYLDFLGPTVHPSLSGYAMPAVVGGVLNTMGDAYKNRPESASSPSLDDDQLMQLELQIARMDRAHAEGHAEGGKVGEGVADSIQAAMEYVRLHNSQAKELKKAFSDVGAKMWSADDAHRLNPKNAKYISDMIDSGTMKPSDYELPRPLTVLNSHPKVAADENLMKKLNDSVDEIVGRYRTMWHSFLGE